MTLYLAVLAAACAPVVHAAHAADPAGRPRRRGGTRGRDRHRGAGSRRGHGDGVLVVDPRRRGRAGLVGSVVMTPSPVRRSSPPSCVVFASDLDDDPLSIEVSWEVEGLAVSTDPTLASDVFVRGDTVRCGATPSDGTDSGGTMWSDALVVVNAVSSAAGARILPVDPGPGDSLTCEAVGFADADGDAEASTFAWWAGPDPLGSGPILPGPHVADRAITCAGAARRAVRSGTRVGGGRRAAGHGPAGSRRPGGLRRPEPAPRPVRSPVTLRRSSDPWAPARRRQGRRRPAARRSPTGSAGGAATPSRRRAVRAR